MSAWGFNILENDTSADAYGEYVDYINSGLSPAQATDKIRNTFSEVLTDPEDSAYLWLGIAKAKWEHGHLNEEMISQIEAIAVSETHLSEWGDAGPKARAKRQRVLQAFVAKLRTPNPRARKPRKAILRTPIYEPGTCLSISRPDGRFLAALVTLHPLENPSPGQDTYGINTIVLLDYLEPKPPTLEVFQRRDFAREENDVAVRAWVPIVRMCFANFHRKAKDSLHIVGQIPLTRADAFVPNTPDIWNFLHAEAAIQLWRQNRNPKDLRRADHLGDLPEIQALTSRIKAAVQSGHFGKCPPRKTLEETLDFSPLR